MFDSIVKELASRFGLGDRAQSLVQMLLAYATNPQTGGLSGFLEKFKTAGLGAVTQSWLGNSSNPQPVSSTQIESVLGGTGGLLSAITSKLGVSGSTASSALAFALPLLLSKLTPQGAVPTSLPAEAMAFIGNAKDWLNGGAAAGATAAAYAGAKTTGGMGRWLPWVILAAVVLGGTTWCKGRTGDTAAVPAPSAAVVPAPAAPAASTPTSAPVVPEGAGVLANLLNGTPSLKVYFDTGKTDIAPAFGDAVKALVDYAKANPDAKLSVSGFNDPTGDAAVNAALSKSRAEAVVAALKTAGVPETSITTEKPAGTTGTGTSNAEARRVEVTVKK